MHFCEKLDFLMKLTNTTNSSLSLYIKLDASYISRLRRGKRSALKNVNCIKAIAAYFARNLKDDYQRNAIEVFLGININITDYDELTKDIMKWLIEETDDNPVVFGNFIPESSNFNFMQSTSEKYKKVDSKNTHPKTDVSVYYGNMGKREASLNFLSAVIAQDKPQTLLLFSDESTDWMTEDDKFISQWDVLMTQILSKGHRIKIIHTVSRSLDEMLSAIHHWLPLYMTGQIEPYFYPKKRDGIFKKTLFICPDVSAVVASSVGYSIENSANILIRNPKMIQSYAKEFDLYLKLCKPLAHIYEIKDEMSYFNALVEYEKTESNSLVKTESLSLLTMPEELILKLNARISNKAINLRELLEYRKRLFEENLKNNSFIEIIQLFDTNDIKSGKVNVIFSKMIFGITICYTLDEYIIHLKNVIHLLGKYKNFHIRLHKSEMKPEYMIYAREDIGVFVVKSSNPSIVLVVNEANLASTFWDFLQGMIADKDSQSNNNKTIKMLTDYIQSLQ